MKLFKWIRGRQESCRYYKYCFLFTRIWKIGLDGYILAYPKGAHLPLHKDPIRNGGHFRLNITLRGRAYFGLMKEATDEHLLVIKYDSKIFHLFRPDLHEHRLDVQTRTYKLSLGLAIFSKNGKRTNRETSATSPQQSDR